MIEKVKIQNKQVMFRFREGGIYSGTVNAVDDDGIWVDCPKLVAELSEDQVWGKLVKQASLSKPVIFLPHSSLMYLITSLG
jgi:hypothetical protein